MERKTVAIVGSGISGLSLAWLLREKYKVTLIEQEDRPGGHAHTVWAKNLPIDVGFIVFNKKTYPLLCAFFKALGVPIAKSNMSFSVSLDQGSYEYSGTKLKGFFAQTSNLWNLNHYQLGYEVWKFNRAAKEFLEVVAGNPDLENMTLVDFLDNYGLSQLFRSRYLYPMAGAIWSTGLERISSFPAKSILDFFDNHNLLQVKGHHQWYTVEGGSQVYVNKILTQLESSPRLNTKIEKIIPEDGRVTLHTSEGAETFDYVVFASQPAPAIGLFDALEGEVLDVLKKFQSSCNTAYLHTDEKLMPRYKRAWSSWNYLGEEGETQMSLSYWMNLLQNLEAEQNYMVTLNPRSCPQEDKIIGKYTFYHPLYTQKSVDAQAELQTLQGQQGIFFCGAYLRHGFHEDGIWSAIQVAKRLGVDSPWKVEKLQ